MLQRYFLLILPIVFGVNFSAVAETGFKPYYTDSAVVCPKESVVERYIQVPLFHDLKSVAHVENIPNLKTHDTLRQQYEGAHLQIYFELLKPFNEEQETIIFIPGGPGQTHTFIHQMMLMLESVELDQNYNILVMDHRGVGCSRPTFPGNEPPESLLMRYAASDIELIRQELMGAEGQIHVWGGSYGTMLAQTYALLYPEQTKSLFLWEGFSSHRDYAKAQRKFESLVTTGVPGIYDRYYKLKQDHPEYTKKFLERAGSEMYDYFGRTQRLKEIFDNLVTLLDEDNFSGAEELLSFGPTPSAPAMPWMMRSIACMEIFSWKPLYPDEFNIFGSTFDSCEEFAGHEDYFDYTDLLKNISAPTFLFSSFYDHVTPYEAMIEMHNRLPNSYIYLDPHLGHKPQKPKCLMNFIASFFAGASDSDLDEISYSPACRNRPPLPENVEI